VDDSGFIESSLEFMNVQVYSCSWSPDGTKVVSCSNDKTLRVWDVSRGECIVTLTGHDGWASDYLLVKYYGCWFIE
jgi:WD40 repeat protein